MTINAPLLKDQNAHDVTQQVEDALRKQHGWKGQPGGAGGALTQLFGRLAELVINRLNRVPDKHFLQFLNEAGVDRLAPRPARADVTFALADDGPEVIHVPLGTQVATLQTETLPELVFETQERATLTPNSLQHCIAFDRRAVTIRVPLDDGTISPGDTGNDALPVFQGQVERERILCLGDAKLFGFTDPASRASATITLDFELSVPGDPAADGWALEWLYWDVEGWTKLVEAGAHVDDGTHNLSQNGEVQLIHLPEIVESEIDGQTSRWLKVKLMGGTARDHLPVLQSVHGRRRIEITAPQTAAIDAAWTGLQTSASFVPLDLAHEFFPLGLRPARLDAFYLACTEAFSKPGATIVLEITGLDGIPEEESSDEIDSLTVVWEYYSTEGWTTLGTSTRTSVSPVRLGFDDGTFAFTKSNDGSEPATIAFTVPAHGGADPAFVQTTVNGQQGYWIRARIAAGSYNIPPVVDVKSRLMGTYAFVEPKTYAPVIKKFVVSLSGYTETSEARRIARYQSQVDSEIRDHSSQLAALDPIAAFGAKDEGPGFYLGFARAFPADEYIQLLLDAEKQFDPNRTLPVVIWEYWSGQWSPLKANDGSQDLQRRGYLGFYAPNDRIESVEFGHRAFWMRARPHLRLPQADAGENQEIKVEGDGVTVRLDASKARAFDRQHIHRYRWRLVSSCPPEANAGPDRTVEKPTVTLDGSASTAVEGQPIVKYIWRQVAPTADPETELQLKSVQKPTATPYLKAIRLNTVSALNATTYQDEVLGSSDGSPDQVYSLVHAPLLEAPSFETGGFQIAVREPDRPPKDELDQLESELKQVNEKAEALLPWPEGAEQEGREVWVRWHQVPGFYDSKRYSRHYVLDPIDGKVHFGDGTRGSVPPPGRDNIKAAFYRTHDAQASNVESRAIAVLRNPSDDLAEIRSVVNYEPAAGALQAEDIEDVKERGPQTIKHRRQAVTQGGFVWLAREADVEVAQTFCVPARNPLGLPEAGWVTVVVLPRSEDAKPTPSPALLRQVKKYLADRSLTNLTAAQDRIHVKGPEYVEATVTARIVPKNPTESDECKLAVLDQLNEFLHPLKGGPEREGWELGRDVYASEIYAVIEAVEGIDYVVDVQLSGSLHQQQLLLEVTGDERRLAPFDIPTDSRVSTLDKRFQLLLTEPVFEGQELRALSVYDFKVGDVVNLVAADNTVLLGNLQVANVSRDSITFAEPSSPVVDRRPFDAVQSIHGHLRLPLAEEGLDCDRAGRVVGARIQGLQPGDRVDLVAYGQRDPRLEMLTVQEIGFSQDRIFVPAGHLVYPGNHNLEMGLESNSTE